VILQSLSRLTVLTVNLVVTAAVAVFVARTVSLRDAVHAWPRPRLRGWARDPLRRWWAWILGAFVAVGSVYLALVAYVMPSYGYDAVWYHLTAVASRIYAGHINITPHDPIANDFPRNGELSFLWVGVLTKGDLLIDVPQIGFALLGALAVVAIARVAGVSRAGAVVAGSLYFLTPIVLAQASTNYVDLVLPGLFLAGFAFLFRYTTTLAAGHASDPRHDRTLLLLAGAGVGLAAGAKTSGLVYAAVALVLLGINVLVAVRHRRLRGRAALGALTLFVVPMLALGSFWYVRSCV
jgi:4-amino-4-deoxy-L-arabinose transferase-like glycosyltransferase